MLIRPERPEDHAALHGFVRTAFATARVVDGDEQEYVDRLRAGGGYLPPLALVAEQQGQLAGFVMLTLLAPHAHRVLLLAPLCVALEWRDQGLGGRLVRAALHQAASLGHAGVLLVGDAGYYGRFGFRLAAAFGLSNANGFAPEHFQACELIPGGLQPMAGSVRVPE